jgi:predicted transglutaminase-like cysteine proteinase
VKHITPGFSRKLFKFEAGTTTTSEPLVKSRVCHSTPRRSTVDPRTVPDAALSLPAMHVPARRRPPARRALERLCGAWQLWVQRLLIAAIVVAAFHPRAWDAERMLAAARKQGPQALAGARALQAVMQGAADLDDDGKLAALNQFFNRRIRSAEDIDIWGQIDYWASPLEMLEKGAGDCEDFAIAKYFSLVALGMPVQKLRLVYVRAQIGGPGGAVQAHMVLAYYAAPNAEPLILDSLITEVRPASRRPDLSPVFSFNSEGLGQGVAGAPAGDPAERLSRWREVLAKARAEGFQ